MKKLILILLVVFFAGCSKDETFKTTYQIVNNISHEYQVYSDCNLINTEARYCSREDIIGNKLFNKIPPTGVTEKIEIECDIDTIIVLTTIKLRDSGLRLYITEFKTVERFKNNIIEINLWDYNPEIINKTLDFVL
jgi:hypothetical protein